MSNSRVRKIQHLLIKQLMDQGMLELILPDGIILEIGIVQEDKNGELVKSDDYCYVVATRRDRSIGIDSYNMGVQFKDRGDTVVYESADMADEKGEVYRFMDIV